MMPTHYIIENEEWENYCTQALQFMVPEARVNPYYPCLGVFDEVGEFSGKRKKEIRDHKVFEPGDALAEIGDVCWYLAILSQDAGVKKVGVRASMAYYSNTKFLGTVARSPKWDSLINTWAGVCTGTARTWSEAIDAGQKHSSTVTLTLPRALAMTCILAQGIHPRIALWEVLELNLDKLRSRQARNVIHGDGDKR